ncbi:hypothetical protein NX059_005411 [Plenodomus lindquistii]|nr:hypothetical protein NX059_005411 [Plenodomus lindquistii]
MSTATAREGYFHSLRHEVMGLASVLYIFLAAVAVAVASRPILPFLPLSLTFDDLGERSTTPQARETHPAGNRIGSRLTCIPVYNTLSYRSPRSRYLAGSPQF